MDYNETPGRTTFDAFQQAWAILWKSPLMWAVTMLVVMALTQVVSVPFMIPMQMQIFAGAQAHRNDPFWLIHSPMYWGTLGLQVGAAVFVYPLYTGIMRAGLRVFRGEVMNPGMIFEFNGMYWRLVGLWALTIPAMFVGIMLCYIPGLMVIVISNIAQLLVIERKMNVLEAIDLSARSLWPSIWTAVGVIFVAALASCAGLVACCVGMIVTMPIMYIACGILYAQLFDPVPTSMFMTPPVPPAES